MNFNEKKNKLTINPEAVDTLVGKLDETAVRTAASKRVAGYAEKPLFVLENFSLSANEEETVVESYGSWKIVSLSRADLLRLKTEMKLVVDEIKISIKNTLTSAEADDDVATA